MMVARTLRITIVTVVTSLLPSALFSSIVIIILYSYVANNDTVIRDFTDYSLNSNNG